MFRKSVLTFSFLLLCGGFVLKAQDANKKIKSDLPIPAHPVPYDLSAWKDIFDIVSVDYDGTSEKIVFLLKTKKTLDASYDSEKGRLAVPLGFLDVNGVNMIQDLNVKFDPNPAGLPKDAAVHAFLQIPMETVLNKTRRVRAALKSE